MKIPRGDINGAGEDEMTVTSGIRTSREYKQTNRGERATSRVRGYTHKQKEQTDKQDREGYSRWRLGPELPAPCKAPETTILIQSHEWRGLTALDTPAKIAYAHGSILKSHVRGR